jgi:autotransporter-associated beta strand protein
LANAVSGSGSLTKSGAGTAILSASNSFIGGTTLNAGVLRLDHANAAGTGTITQSDAASTLQVNTTGTVSNAMSLYNLAALSTVTLSGAKTLAAASTAYDIASGTQTTESGALSGSGGLTKNNSGTLALSGSNSYAGATAVSAGILAVAHNNALGGTSAGTTVASGGQLSLQGVTVGNEALTISGSGTGASVGALRAGSGTSTWGGKVTLGANATIGAASGTTLTLDVASGNAIEAANFNLTFDGAGSNLVMDAIDLGTGGLTKIGSGTTTLNGTLGASSVDVQLGTLALGSAGQLAAGATANVSGGILSTGGNETITRLNATGGTLNLTNTLTVTGTGDNQSSIGSSVMATGGTIYVAGTLDYRSTNGTTALSVASGGRLTGSGTTTESLSVAGTLAPGNSTGIMNVGSTTFLGGGKYVWEIDNFDGEVGTNWDFLNITGNLDITAGTGLGNQFLIDVVSLLAFGDNSGLASNFTDSMNYSFAIATASGSINNYDAGKFLINTAGFQNAFNGTWGTSLSGDGKSLNITYTAATAIPEPSSGALTLVGLGLVALSRHRRSRR